MNAPFLKTTRSLLLGALGFCATLSAETTSLTVSGLRNFGPASAPQARVDTISVTLDPATNVLHGKPGQTIGWGYNLTWASNAGDSISFLSSKLTGDLGNICTTGYEDIIGQVRGSTESSVPAGSTWQAAFAAGTSGVGSLTLSPDALPGRTHEGELRLTFEVTDRLGTVPRALKNVVISINVTVVVDEPDPVEPADQTITFVEIPDHSIAEGTFTLSPTASSNRPVRLLSLQPDVCTVEGNVVTIHSAGPCTIIAEQNGNYAFRQAPPVTRTFKVIKVPATVTLLGSLNRNYTGADQTFTTNTTPAGLPVDMLYNGDTIPPRDPGFYLVQALIDDPTYAGTSQVLLTINDTRPAPVSHYGSWLQTKFTPQEILAGAFTDPDANLAGDEFNNLFKYAMGFDPRAPLSSMDREALPRLSGIGGPAVVFDIPTTAAADVIITIQANSDLVGSNWQEIARRVGGGPWTGPAGVFAGTPNPEGTRRSILVTEPPTPIYNSRFYRLQILPNP